MLCDVGVSKKPCKNASASMVDRFSDVSIPESPLVSSDFLEDEVTTFSSSVSSSVSSVRNMSGERSLSLILFLSVIVLKRYEISFLLEESETRNRNNLSMG